MKSIKKYSFQSDLQATKGQVSLIKWGGKESASFATMAGNHMLGILVV